MKLESKLPDVGTTIFTVMTRLANETGAINLSQGFPDFDCAPELVELVHRHMRAGHNQYAPMQGIPLLRERLAAKTAALYGARYDPDTEITISSGATEALFAVITAVVDRDDEVILFEPAYDSYEPAVRLNGGVPVHVPLCPPAYGIDWERVRRTVNARTKLLILNSPHNPTGAVLTAEDIRSLQALVRDTDLLILSDEVYEHIIFDGLQHESMARYPDLAARSFVVSSFGKTYHTTGWKLGYCLAPAPLTAEFRKIHQFLTFACNTPMQLAYADFLTREEAYLTLAEFYQRKRDLFAQYLAASRFRRVPCRGTYFQILDYAAISSQPDSDFAVRLAQEAGVVAIPPSVFYHNRDDHKVLRFCFAKKDETLEKAAEKLCRI